MRPLSPLHSLEPSFGAPAEHPDFCMDCDFTLRGLCLLFLMSHWCTGGCIHAESTNHPHFPRSTWIPLLSWGPESSSQNLRTRAHLLPSFLFALLRAKQGPLQLFSGFPAMARGKPGHLEPRPWTWRDSAHQSWDLQQEWAQA